MKEVDYEEVQPGLLQEQRSASKRGLFCAKIEAASLRSLMDGVTDDSLFEILDMAQGEARVMGTKTYVVIEVIP